MLLNQRQIQHLYWRTGFGISPTECRKRIGSTPESLVDEIFENSKEPYVIKVIKENNALAGPYPSVEESEEVRQFRRQRHRARRLVNLTWMYYRQNYKADLREKMTLFWHNHFACEFDNPYYAQVQINMLSANALGSFGRLVENVAKDPGMLIYLNNQQNSKQAPNENFARELMELFTIGRGNFTEIDVKEAARAFTGWQTIFDCEEWQFTKWSDDYPCGGWSFHKSEDHHDFGTKSVLGKTGNFDGEDIIAILLENKLTAKRMAQKIYEDFVNERIDDDHIAQISETFYASNYDISALLRQIFTSEWFYDDKNIGVKIKSPMEYLVGMLRTLNGSLAEKRDMHAHVQQQLGQLLLEPPNVGGWPRGRNWINNSSLFYRMKMPEIILSYSNVDDPFEFYELKANGKYKPKINGKADLRKLYEEFSAYNNNELFGKMYESLIQSGDNGADLTNPLIVRHSSLFLSNLRKIMQMPEYQLC